MTYQHELRLKDEQTLRDMAKATDEAVSYPVEPPCFIPAHHKEIGIDYHAKTAGRGYVKLHHRDFIVEEIRKDNSVVSLDEDSHSFPEPTTTSPKVWAELIKLGTGTFDAIELLSDTLGIPMDQISYAGIKDGRAITAQEVSFRNFDTEKIVPIQTGSVMLRNIHKADGVLSAGQLNGNRFTILIRSDNANPYKVHELIDGIKANGFYNFYSLQRFGTRLTSHLIGRTILQGDYEQAIRMFLCGESPHEIAYMQQLRKEAAPLWGDWKAMQEVFGRLPYFFRHEMSVLNSLIASPANFAAALVAGGDHSKMMFQAYCSYLYNRLLSYYIEKGQVPESIPHFTPVPEDLATYRQAIPDEEIRSLQFKHPELPFVFMRRGSTPTRIVPNIHAVKRVDVGFLFHFDLGKGSYATTFLSQLFELYQGMPSPEWTPRDVVETREPLGFISIDLIEGQFPKEERPIEITE